jgi:hypothetical protein
MGRLTMDSDRLVPYSPAMSRRLHALAVLVIAISALLSLGAQSSCSGDVAAPKRAGEPCTRTSECESGLVCGGGVCRLAGDASVDAATDH